MTDSSAHEASTSSGHDRRWAVLGVLCLSMFLVVVDNTIVNVALPTPLAFLPARAAGSSLDVDLRHGGAEDVLPAEPAEPAGSPGSVEVLA